MIHDLKRGNKLTKASEFYLSSKISSKNDVIRVGKFNGKENIIAGLVKDGEVIDNFDGIEITWAICHEKNDDRSSKYFEIIFEEKYWEKVFNQYLKHIMNFYQTMKTEVKTLNIYTWSRYGDWSRMDFDHPATLDMLAMDYDAKKSVIDDLDKFLGRKDYYKRIGKAWKRGYLLYGPPGTGKSSLIAAMANYLKFDVYNLELANIRSDAELRRALLDVDRKSITVIEDIDCHSEVHNRSQESLSDCSDESDSSDDEDSKFSLSSMLNSIDGLWASCWEERIIVFTTNHKEVLDPALLRAGRMDMHIHMSYCTRQGFRILAKNYLGIDDHPLYEEIDALIENVEATPAALAEEFLKGNDDVELSLRGVLKFLEQK